MKDKILMLIIGILIGAVITAGGFLLFGKGRNKDNKMDRRNFNANMIDGGRRGRPGDENNMEQPPVIPEDNGITSPDAVEGNT